MKTVITVERPHITLVRTLYGPVSDERFEREQRNAHATADGLVPYERPRRREIPLDAYGSEAVEWDYPE